MRTGHSNTSSALTPQTMLGKMPASHWTFQKTETASKVLRVRMDLLVAIATTARGQLVETPHLESLEYDPLGRLRRAQRRDDGTVVELEYDFAGFRVLRRVTRGGVTEEKAYIDGYLEVTEDSVAEIVRDPVSSVRRPTDGSEIIMLADRLGSPVLATNASSGEVVSRRAYHAYGGLRAGGEDGIAMPGFTAHNYDADLEFYYFGSRYYDPLTARFIQPDPMLYRFLQGSGNNGVFEPRNLNLYAYAYGDPVDFVDPNGELGFLAVVLIGAAVGALVGGGISAGTCSVLGMER